MHREVQLGDPFLPIAGQKRDGGPVTGVRDSDQVLQAARVMGEAMGLHHRQVDEHVRLVDRL